MEGESKSRALLLIVMSFIVALSGLLFGYDTGVISSAILYIKSDYALTLIEEELIIGILSLGALIGAIFGGPSADRFGRKKVILISSLIFIGSAAGLALSTGANTLIIYRFIVGLAIGVSSSVAPMYIAELSPRSMRGGLVTLNQLSITIGILLAFITGVLFANEQSWRWMFGLACFPAILQFIVMLFFPESPRWLLGNGQEEKGLKILKGLRGNDGDAQLEADHILSRSSQDDSSWRELFRNRYRGALAAGIGITIIQQLTGINIVIYYAPTIFQFAGFASAKAAVTATMWVGVVNVVMTFVAIALIDKIGRKPLIICGLSGMTIALLVLGVGFEWAKAGDNSSEIMGWIAVISTMVFVASFAFSLGPGGWLINSEVYPLKVRGKANGVATSANWATNFIVTGSFLSIVNLLGRSGAFWLFAIIGILGIIYIINFIPETKGRSLEEIEDYWNRRKKT